MIKKSSNDYKIIKPLGTGGTAEVFLAEHKLTGKLTALKNRRKEALELCQFLSLIKREYQLISGQRYPGLLKIHDLLNPDSDDPSLALEYCPYPTLDEIGKIESLPTLLNILSSISVNFFYQRLVGISHGDIKPQNIFLTTNLDRYENAENLYTKISDFSLALLDGEDYSERLGLGTLGYCAPETIDSDILNIRSDIFSFGVIAYYLATGINPFIREETDPVKINANIKELIPEFPSKLDSKIPLKLSELIMRMIDKNPAQRPDSGFDIAETLHEIGAGYNHRKAIRPKHLISIEESNVDKFLEQDFFQFDNETHKKLKTYSGASINRLRHILEINFTQNKLRWNKGRLTFIGKTSEIIYPRRLQREITNEFNGLSYSQKKLFTLSAIADGFDNLSKLGYSITLPRQFEKPTIECLNQNLSSATLRRFGNKLAARSKEKLGDSALTARLYIRAKNASDGFNCVIAATKELFNNNENAAAIKILQTYLNICDDNRLIEYRRKALLELGEIYRQTGEFNEAEAKYLEIAQSYNEDISDKLLAETFKALGDVYKSKRSYVNGIEALKKAEIIYLELNDQLELSHTMNNLGNIYTIENKLDIALKTFRKALRIQRRLDASHDIASTLNNIAAIYYYKGMIPRTLKFFNEALKLQRQIGNSGEIARTLNNIGITYVEKGDYDYALEAIEESFNLNKRIGSKKELLFNYENLTSVMLSAGKLKEAYKHLKQGMQLALELKDYPHTATFYSTMGSVQKRMGFYGKAIRYFKKTLELLDSISDEYLKSFCFLELADIYLKLNNQTESIDYLNRHRELSQKIDDNKALIFESIIRGEINEDISMIQTAVENAQAIDAGKSVTVARLRLANYLLRNKEMKRFKEIIDEISGNYLSERSDIEKAFYFNLLGRYYLSNEDFKNAFQYFNMASRHATDSHLNPELIEAFSGLGLTFFKENDYESSYGFYRKALNILKLISKDLNKDDKLNYLKRSNVIQIMQDVKRLNLILAGKPNSTNKKGRSIKEPA